MQRFHYIVRPALQLKYVVAVVVIISLTALALYFSFWSSLIHSAGLERLSAGDMRALERAYQTNFAWVVVILLCAFGLLSIYIFHRIAGPLYVFERAIKNLATGDLTTDISLRKHDELKEIAGELQGMIDNIRDAVIEDRKIIKEAAENSPAAVKEKLSSVTKWFKTE